jgi:dTDP-4-amino-4,6-dideoxygalactose transaminase
VLDPAIDRAWFKEQVATRHDVRLAGEVYDLPLHLQPILHEYALRESLPIAEDMCNRHICLPVHSDMRDDEVDEVLTAVIEVAAEAEERACASR